MFFETILFMNTEHTYIPVSMFYWKLSDFDEREILSESLKYKSKNSKYSILILFYCRISQNNEEKKKKNCCGRRIICGTGEYRIRFPRINDKENDPSI